MAYNFFEEFEDNTHIKNRQVKDFHTIVEEVQEHISNKHSGLLSSDKSVSKIKEQIKLIIEKYISDNGLFVENLSHTELIDKISSEMVEYSFLTDYIFTKNNDIEEININSWEDIKINYSDGSTVTAKEKFNSPQHAVNVIRKLLRESNMILDNSYPVTRGHLSNKIRITCCGGEIIDKHIGVVASIRIINPKKLGKQDFINNGTGTQEMFDFLEIVLRYGLSICVGGSTNTGKTTFMSWLLQTLPDYKRTITVEDGVREFDLIKKDEEGRVLNNIVHLTTKRSENKNQNIDQLKLLEYSLTMNPDYICMAEMKGGEAYAAQEAGRTGHTIITTVHTNSSMATYSRLATLCGLENNLDNTTLMNLVTEAFPIVLFMKRGEDGVRRIMEITATTTLSNGEIERITLWKFKTEKNEINSKGERQIIGHFEKLNSISENIVSILRGNGAPDEVIEKLI
jgi:pilus assembly protein CpaF|nr:CpaF/VirB11 family protein [Clostridioides sp.]